ncbi:MAG: calcium/sodium antiporter [Clostridia bacterium]|nr:calcium/sodium antiporter [Clostridia bacterium]
MLVPVLLFLLGLLMLIKGGDWFVDGATGIARRFHIPEIIVGATVVSIGTTLPEVMVSATSAVKGAGGIAYGNAVGSVICNSALIAALTVAVKPGPVDRKSFRTPVAFFFAAAAFYLVNAYAFRGFSRIAGIVLLLIFAVYMTVTIRQGISGRDLPAEPAPEHAEDGKSADKPKPLWLEIVLLIIGAALIAIGADLLVDNGTIIAEKLGVPQSVIALTFVALGTSLPELVTAITSLAKGHGALSLGNVIGANLFNLVLVSGTAATLNPFPIPDGKTIAGMNASLVVDVPVMIAVMCVLTLPALAAGKMKRWQGILLLAVYAAFCVFQFAG